MVSEADKIAVILSGPTSAYAPSRTNLYAASTMLGVDLRFDNVVRTLINSEVADNVQKGTHLRHSSRNTTTPASNPHPKDSTGTVIEGERKKKGACHWCGMEGHWERECRKKKAGTPKKERDSEASAHQASSPKQSAPSGGIASAWAASVVAMKTSSVSRDWILDSACTHHLIKDRENFTTYHEVKNKVVQLGGEKLTIPIVGEGIASLTIIQEDDQHHTMTFSQAYHVPDVAANLIPVHQLATKGAEIEFTKVEGLIRRDGHLICKATLRQSDQQYVFKTSPLVPHLEPQRWCPKSKKRRSSSGTSVSGTPVTKLSKNSKN